MKHGLVSIGTNSTRALVADLSWEPAKILLQRSIGTRIGEGLGERGNLEERAIRRTLDAIAEHVTAIREHTNDIRAIATSALRRAQNEAAFAQRVRMLTDADLEIISGEEEAACAFAGALSGLQAEATEAFGVLDVGGGSSEYAVGTKAGAQRLVSCEIGAVRLTEMFPTLAGTGEIPDDDALERARACAREAIEPVSSLDSVRRIVLVGGSATTTVSLVRAKREYFDYAQLSDAEIEHWIGRLERTPLEARKQLPGINPQRADILLAGLTIIAQFLRATGHRTATVSTNDVLLGYLLRHPSE